jgi:hypothetical protein
MIFPKSGSRVYLFASRLIVFLFASLLLNTSHSSAVSVGLKVGDIVVSQQSSGRISVVDPVTGSTTTAMSNSSLSGLSQVVLDSQNRAVVATRNTYGVLRFDFATGLAQSIASAPYVQDSTSLAFDLAGNLLVGSRDDWLTRIDLTSGIQQHLSQFSSSSVIQDIQVGSDGTIFVLDYGQAPSAGRVIKVNPLSGAQQVLTQGGNIDHGADMVIGPDGNLIVVSSMDNTSKLVRVDAMSGQQQFLQSLSDEGFIALDRDGTLLFAGFHDKNVSRVNLTTGAVTTVGSIGGIGNLTGIAVVLVPEPGTTTLIFLCTFMAIGRRGRR